MLVPSYKLRRHCVALIKNALLNARRFAALSRACARAHARSLSATAYSTRPRTSRSSHASTTGTLAAAASLAPPPAANASDWPLPADAASARGVLGAAEIVTLAGSSDSGASAIAAVDVTTTTTTSPAVAAAAAAAATTATATATATTAAALADQATASTLLARLNGTLVDLASTAASAATASSAGLTTTPASASSTSGLFAATAASFGGTDVNTSLEAVADVLPQDCVFHATFGNYLMLVSFGFIFCLSICGNSMVIVVITCQRSMRSVTNHYLLSLAVADLLLSVLCMPPTLVNRCANQLCERY